MHADTNSQRDKTATRETTELPQALNAFCPAPIGTATGMPRGASPETYWFCIKGNLGQPGFLEAQEIRDSHYLENSGETNTLYRRLTQLLHESAA